MSLQGDTIITHSPDGKTEALASKSIALQASLSLDLCPLQTPSITPTPTSEPGAHLAKVVKVVLVPDPPVTGLGTVRFVGDVPGVLALAHEELPFEELDTHVPETERSEL